MVHGWNSGLFDYRMKEQDQKRGTWIHCNLLIFLIVFKDF